MAGNGNPISTANLAPRWQPGQSGNPGGRPKGVVYPAEWMARLADHTRSELEAIINDDAQPISRQAAASLLLRAGAGHIDAVNVFCDRTAGKPHQSKTIIRADVPSARELVKALRERLWGVAGGSGRSGQGAAFGPHRGLDPGDDQRCGARRQRRQATGAGTRARAVLGEMCCRHPGAVAAGGGGRAKGHVTRR